MPHNRLPAWLNEQLNKRGMTQFRLAEELETNPTNISRWLKGQRPDFDACIALAAFFGTEPEKVLELVGKRGLLERLKKMKGLLDQTVAAAHELKAEDAEVHRLLQSILDSGGSVADGVRFQITAVSEHLRQRQSGRKHGPFAPSPGAAKAKAH